MATDEPTGSRTQLLSRLQQFMDMTLRDLAKASESKDPDTKEIQAIRSALLKIVIAWKQATSNSPQDSPNVSSEIGRAKKAHSETREG